MYINRGITLDGSKYDNQLHCTKSYITTVSDASNLTTYTFNTTSIGEPASNRYIIAMPRMDTTATLTFTSLTLDGNAMTLGDQGYNAGSFTRMAIYYYPWPTGTTANLIMTCSTTCLNMEIPIYTANLIRGVKLGGANDNRDTTADISLTSIDIMYGGVAFAGVVAATASITNTMSWSGADTWTKDSERTLETTSHSVFSMECKQTAAFTATIAESATSSRAGVCVSFQ